MKTLKTKLAVTTACLLAAGSAANASITVGGSVGGAPAGTVLINFDNLPLGAGGGVASGIGGSVNVSFASDGLVAQGALGGVYAAPYLSDQNGNGFGAGGSQQPLGADTTHYLSTGVGTVTLQFGPGQKYMGLLWGSVDDYNTLSFYNGNTLVGAVTGSQVTASPNGDQGVNGSLYVNITTDTAFDRVVASSSQYAFEFDNVAFKNTVNPVPEPSTIFAGALLLMPFGLSTLRSLRRNRE